jgi:hypothetical protein
MELDIKNRRYLVKCGDNEIIRIRMGSREMIRGEINKYGDKRGRI